MATATVMLVLRGMAMFVQISMNVHLEIIHARRMLAAETPLDHIVANVPMVTGKTGIASTWTSANSDYTGVINMLTAPTPRAHINALVELVFMETDDLAEIYKYMLTHQ